MAIVERSSSLVKDCQLRRHASLWQATLAYLNLSIREIKIDMYYSTLDCGCVVQHAT